MIKNQTLCRFYKYQLFDLYRNLMNLIMVSRVQKNNKIKTRKYKKMNKTKIKIKRIIIINKLMENKKKMRIL